MIIVFLIWLVVSTHLKNISQIGSFPQIGMKKNKKMKPQPSDAPTLGFSSIVVTWVSTYHDLERHPEPRLPTLSPGLRVEKTMEKTWSFGSFLKEMVGIEDETNELTDWGS